MAVRANPNPIATSVTERKSRPVDNSYPSSSGPHQATPAGDDSDEASDTVGSVQSLKADKDGNIISRGPKQPLTAKRISPEEFGNGR